MGNLRRSSHWNQVHINSDFLAAEGLLKVPVLNLKRKKKAQQIFMRDELLSWHVYPGKLSI